ncbi:MAG: Hsp20/alpha crystallin family protein [Candidatus Melainabacteria bacterium]|nr:MAG: Hsp20/alpha crystallin family protein [Candidatus Melainabacteria bacterium]
MLFQELVSPSFFDSRQMNVLQNRLNNLLSSVAARDTEFPLLNTYISEDKALVVAEIPGVDLDDIDLQVVNKTLTINTQRNKEDVSEGTHWYRRERAYGQFSRVIELPFAIDVDSVLASCTQGVLKIELPRAQADLPKKISIQSA